MPVLTGDFKDERVRAIAAELVTVYPIERDDLMLFWLCPACSSSAFETVTSLYVGELEAFRTVICGRCLHVWRAITPTSSWFTRCAALLRNDDIKPSAELEGKREAAYERRLEFIGPWGKEKRALDIGAAFGAGYHTLRRQNYKVTVLETDPNRVEYMREQCRFDRGDYKAAVIADTIEDLLTNAVEFTYADRFGLIMMCHVLEHLRDPAMVLAKLHRLLVPGGIAYVEVPSSDIINWSDALYLAHQSNFSGLSFARMVANAGLKILAYCEFIHENDRVDMGYVLTVGKDAKKFISDASATGTGLILREFAKVKYRKNLPIEVGDGSIKYRAPYLDHYNYGLRFNRWSMIKNGEFIDFVEDGHGV